MKISILHPSYQRPELARKCYDEWMGKCDDVASVEYVLCLSSNDESAYEAFPEAMVVYLMGDNGLVKQVNYAATFATGDLLIAISDDFGCPEHWDTLLREALQGNQDYVVKTQDGIQPYIMTLPMMDRKYYERFGYIYHPSYRHMYGDQELADVGALLGRTINLPLEFPHRHYSTGAMPRDATNKQNDSFMQVDAMTYKERKANNFGL